MNIRRCIAAAVAALSAAGASWGQDITLSAKLSGAEEVPPTPSLASGTATYVYHPATRTIDINVFEQGFDALTITGNHIHRAAKGVNGPVIIDFGPGGWVAEGSGFRKIKLGLPVAAADEAALLSGGCYTNLHTPAFTSGEIRGQIATDIRLTATLTGAQEVPPTPSTATGNALFIYHPPLGTIDINVFEKGFDGATITGNHIHRAPKGVNGPVIVDFGPGGWVAEGSGFRKIKTGLPVAPADESFLLTGGCYVNLHTPAFGGGEIRGQIGKECRPDINGDGVLDIQDFSAFQNLFALSDPKADYNGDGKLDIQDFTAFQNSFALGCA